jgi:Ca2+-binding RTX toxin-like protein
VTVNLAILEDQNTYGAGTDTLVSIENLVGSMLDDVLSGNDGVNYLIGVAGADVLAGGGGADVFAYSSIGDSVAGAADRIVDFTHAATPGLPHDILDLSAIDADVGLGGDQAFHFGATAGHAGDIVLSYDSVANQTTMSLYVDADAVADGVILFDGNHLVFPVTDIVL